MDPAGGAQNINNGSTLKFVLIKNLPEVSREVVWDQPNGKKTLGPSQFRNKKMKPANKVFKGGTTGSFEEEKNRWENRQKGSWSGRLVQWNDGRGGGGKKKTKGPEAVVKAHRTHGEEGGGTFFGHRGGPAGKNDQRLFWLGFLGNEAGD